MTKNLGRAVDPLELHKSLSNWGRWGGEDEVGTFNYITSESRRRAAALVKLGRTVSCSRYIHLGVSSHPQSSYIAYKDARVAMEYIGFVYHGPAMTHLDGLGHIFHDGMMYNGFSADEVGLKGSAKCDVAKLKEGVVTRGVLLDIPRLREVEELTPGEAIHVDELEEAEKAEGVEVGAGDVLFVRTGFTKAWMEGRVPSEPDSFPGCHADCLPFFHDRGVVVLGSDGINDVVPSGFKDPSQPIHDVGQVALGLYLIDNADFEELASVCRAEGRWEFLVIVPPLPIVGGTGSPVNPLAVL